jgi:protein TonB
VTVVAGESVARLIITNTGAEAVHNVNANVKWFAAPEASTAAASADTTVPAIQPGQIVQLELSPTQATVPNAQRVVRVAVVGVPTQVSTFMGSVANEPEPAPATQGPLSGTFEPPRQTKNVDPVYPRVAQAMGLQGEILLDVRIMPDGTVGDVLIRTPTLLLDDAAVQAVRQWEYSPPTVNGNPISVVRSVTTRFTLKQ